MMACVLTPFLAQPLAWFLVGFREAVSPLFAGGAMPTPPIGGGAMPTPFIGGGVLPGAPSGGGVIPTPFIGGGVIPTPLDCGTASIVVF